MKPSRILLSAAAALALSGAAGAQIPVTFTDINADQSTLDPTNPNGASGGRVTGIGVDVASPGTYYAASEWGGLFKSTDGGLTWAHLPGHVPTATWDVAVDPGNSNRVFATSFYDGKATTLAGISVSTDAGVTWSRPATATPPAAFNCVATRRAEPHAFGISFDPDDPNDVYIGTNCGLAVSNNLGATWNFIDPTPATTATDIWDVVVHDGGIIDVCGDDGHLRSTTGGASWTTAAASPLPNGLCSLAVSPDEPYVLFATVGPTVFESDDGGQSWPFSYAIPNGGGRIPFVATNQRTGATYDLWAGAQRLFRGVCTTPAPANPGGARRCNLPAAWVNEIAGAHFDSGDIAFNPTVAVDACPTLYSSDGGVFRNTTLVNPFCHAPTWQQPNVTPHALWNFDFELVSRAGVNPEDIYHGNQDNGSFGALDGGAPSPTWTNERCCDGFDVAADSNQVVNTICCFAGATRLFLSSPGYIGPTAQIAGPPGALRAFDHLDSIANFGPDDYLVITSQGVFVTDDITAAVIDWDEIGAASTPFSPCGVQVSRQAGAPVFFVKSGGCDGDVAGGLFRYQGAAPGGTWQQVPSPPGGGGFGVFSVDANDPDRIIGSHLGGIGGPRMAMTLDGGANWHGLPALDDLMTGGGEFPYANTTGPDFFTNFTGYPQPTLVKISPLDTDIVVAGGADSGVFLSTNGGTRWQRVTDPFTPGVTGTPHIPRPFYAEFDDDAPGDEINLFLGTRGRGVWRLAFEKVPMPEIQIPAPLHFGDVCVGDTARETLEVCNTSAGDLVVSQIVSSNPEFVVTEPSSGFPVTISHDFCFPFEVEFTPAAAGPRSATLTVSSNDPNFPEVDVDADGNGTVPDVRVTGSTDYGVISAWRPAERTVSICNLGDCDLNVVSATIDCADFALVADPLPASLPESACLDLVVRFTPSAEGVTTCELTVTTDDPDTPVIQRTLTARTPPFFSLHAGLVDPQGSFGNIAKQGSTYNLDFVYHFRPKWAWDVRLGFSSFDGRAGLPDTDLWNLSANARFTINPPDPARVFLNGGLGLYHFDPGDFEGGGNLGLGLNVPVSRRFAFEATFNYHWAFTASPTLEFGQIQAGFLVSF